jgi:hypothetical protein
MADEISGCNNYDCSCNSLGSVKFHGINKKQGYQYCRKRGEYKPLKKNWHGPLIPYAP